jgi:hypothetical protein
VGPLSTSSSAVAMPLSRSPSPMPTRAGSSPLQPVRDAAVPVPMNIAARLDSSLL